MTDLPFEALDTYTVTDIQAMSVDLQPAFEKAVMAVQACGVDNRSHHLGNVLWDPIGGKCYIVDFERSKKAKPGPVVFHKEFGCRLKHK